MGDISTTHEYTVQLPLVASTHITTTAPKTNDHSTPALEHQTQTLSHLPPDIHIGTEA
jgi:hypothetical protein